MFRWLGTTIIKTRWFIVAALVAIYAVGAAWGTGVFDDLADGGFVNPDAPSVVTSADIEERFGHNGAEVLILYSHAELTVDDDEFAAAVTSSVDEVAALSPVSSATSYFNTGLDQFVSTDRHSTFVAVEFHSSDEDGMLSDFRLVEEVAPAEGVTTQLGGPAAMFSEIGDTVKNDLIIAEIISLPLLLIIMVLVFGAVVAALMPMIIAGMAILGGLAITRVLTYFVDVSVFAVNVITIIGLGMSIDYCLFVLRRFREELAAGRDKRTAVLNTVATAGRTVGVSGLIIVLCMAGLLFIPLPFLHGIAYGVMAAVGVAMLGAMVVLPAMLYLLGHRIDKLKVLRKQEKRSGGDSEGFWYRVGSAVMARPILVLVAVALGLGALAIPAFNASFGGVNETTLPPGSEPRLVIETLREDFPGQENEVSTVMVEVESDAVLEQVLAGLRAVSNVEDVVRIDTTETHTLFEVGYEVDSFSPEARHIVHDIRDLDIAGAQLEVTGETAYLVDMLADIRDNVPALVIYIAVVTFILLFLAFGSIILPIKAILMNLLSLGACIGIVVWIFQYGNLSGILFFEATGYIDPTNLILMLVILFALSTDYEVFLLSRAREEWDNGADNRTAVLRAMQRTGGIITAAAIILIVVVGAFSLSSIVMMKMVGVGMAVAIFLDATVVRMLLVPSTMRLLGRANWWVPGPLAKLYSSYGLERSAKADAEKPTSTKAAD
ncbi:MMPL family transporter [Natronoglycomyces albus]|uniref:MMPL family transporter n=1 Tax=Natronoglycomyces albus TaxID=2811108 RepID=A0A895XRT3_9ACTN|nr:MMPL family transporter [Natronoglycomyces albus]QSB06233.1 MMPL family transporter [Natronoglycomyces albus]